MRSLPIGAARRVRRSRCIRRPMPDSQASGKVAILLSTFNGEPFLEEQLASIAAQSHRDWVLYWRDDGSTDRTCQLMARFMAGAGASRCIVPDAPGRIGVTHSFLALLRAAACDRPAAFAFADQDDVWLPDKLSLGLAALAPVPATIPTLYCARQILVGEKLNPLGLSFRLHCSPGFPAALTQNLATGCTVMLNPAAGQLIRRSQAPAATHHDWWSYLLVTAAGGRLIMDEEPVGTSIASIRTMSSGRRALYRAARSLRFGAGPAHS